MGYWKNTEEKHTALSELEAPKNLAPSPPLVIRQKIALLLHHMSVNLIKKTRHPRRYMHYIYINQCKINLCICDLKKIINDLQAPNTKLFWRHTIEGEEVEFDCTPFTVSEVRRLDCQFGRHYYKERPTKSGHTRLQGTRKIGCPTHITIKTLVLFPKYKIEDPFSFSSRKLKEIKKEQLRQLQEASEVKSEIKYYVVLPTKEAHHSVHDTEGIIGYAQRMHPKLSEKVHDLVSEGITSVPEVTRALKFYVNHTLCPNSKPDPSNRSYYPIADDIRNHIYRAQKLCQLSSLDQENLRLKIEQWKKMTLENNFYSDHSQNQTLNQPLNKI